MSGLDFTITIPNCINFICPSGSSNNSTPQTAATSVPQFVDAATASEWIFKFNNSFSRFEKIERNGAYPLLEKEVNDITPLLHQGQIICGANTRYPVVASIIDDLVKPRLVQLQTKFASAQKKLGDMVDKKEEETKLVKKWNSLGLPESVLEGHVDCARFLMESGLAFAIVGYRETSRNPDLHDLKLAPDGHPMIKVQGVFKRWEVVKQELVYDPETYQIRSKAYPGIIVQNWTYLSPQGLVPIDRLNHDRLVPIYQLSPEERRRTAEFAHRFYETNPEVDPGIAKDWVIQFHTAPRRQFVASLPPLPSEPIYDNLARNLNTHIVMRLVAPNGDVYSFGVEMPAESQEFLWENNMEKFLATVNAKINKAGDYEEFRSHSGRLVTGIPLSTQRAQNIMNLVNNMGDIRFNFLRQNCAVLMQVVLKASGYDIDTQTTVQDSLLDTLPDAKYLPLIGPVADKVNQFFKMIGRGVSCITPQPIQNAVCFVKDVVMYVPNKIMTIFLNLFMLKMGAGKMLHPLPDGVEEEDFYKANRFLNFSRLMRSWSDVFKDEISEVYHSKYFIEWQKQQHSTFTDPYTGRPKLSIVPPAA